MAASSFSLSDFTAIKEREDNIRRAQQAAEEAASAAKSRFLANMSHGIAHAAERDHRVFGNHHNPSCSARSAICAMSITRVTSRAAVRHLLDVIKLGAGDFAQRERQAEPERGTGPTCAIS